ncbi:DHA2 family efflux MFS transporter permease subunit [Effusibacillus pohliae]|uniref:DHA2 family efflux MFS transporter permease subunit n=1 Tax=Effusibacillus pohliae TaxID=232270 RepID=UPI0003691EE7|nr:DHA2 family efflux MFS transporter permease subunit [Effusibacillus pohliae]
MQPGRSQKTLTLTQQTGLLMGPFLTMLDSSIMNVALPEIANRMNSSLSAVQWVITAYLLALSAASAAVAYLAKRFGTLRTYRISLIGFTLSSIACAFAPQLGMLIAARTMQGALGAPLIPLVMGMLMGSEGSRSKNVSPAFGILLFLAPVIGPTIGGVLLHYFGWTSIFLINVPIGIFGVLAAVRLPGDPADQGDPSVRFDPLGFLLLAASLALTIYGASNGPLHGWTSTDAWPYWSMGGGLLLLYVLWSLRHPQPAVPLKLLQRRSAALAVALCALTSVVTFSTVVLIPVLLENIQQHSPLAVGLSLFPQALVTGFGTVLGNKFAEKHGVRASAVTGMLLLTLGTLLLQLVDETTPIWQTAVLLTFRGVAVGMVIQQLLSVILAGLNRQETADANTLFNISQRLGGAVGIALLTTFLQIRQEHQIERLLAGLHLPTASVQHGMPTGAKLPEAVGSQLAQAAIQGFHDTFWLLTLLAFVGFVAAFHLM